MHLNIARSGIFPQLALAEVCAPSAFVVTAITYLLCWCSRQFVLLWHIFTEVCSVLSLFKKILNSSNPLHVFMLCSVSVLSLVAVLI